MKKVLLLLTVLLLSGSAALFAQSEGNTSGKSTPVDSTESNEFNLDDDFMSDFSFNKLFNFKSNSTYLDFHSPTIELSYGKTQTSVADYNRNFADNFNVEARLGMTDTKIISNSKYVVKYDFNYLSLNHVNEKLGEVSGKAYDLGTKTWRVSLGGNNGYGWKIAKESAVILYTGSGIGLNWLTFNDSLETLVEDQTQKTFGNGTRFSMQYEAGVKFKVFKNLTLGAEYETNEIFPRFLFWRTVGSGLIGSAGHGLADWFVGEVKDRAPAITPIVDFVLHTAINYGLYELRKSDMNWPFETADPMMQNNFKITMGFNF